MLFKGTLEAMRQLSREKAKLENEINHKETVIQGLVKDISLADKRQIITRVVRKSANNFSIRYGMLYKEFEQKYHCNLQKRMESYNENAKPKVKNKMDYIDKVMNMIPELYEICAKLFENDVEALKKELYDVVNG